MNLAARILIFYTQSRFRDNSYNEVPLDPFFTGVYICIYGISESNAHSATTDGHSFGGYLPRFSPGILLMHSTMLLAFEMTAFFVDNLGCSVATWNVHHFATLVYKCVWV